MKMVGLLQTAAVVRCWNCLTSSKDPRSPRVATTMEALVAVSVRQGAKSTQTLTQNNCTRNINRMKQLQKELVLQNFAAK